MNEPDIRQVEQRLTAVLKKEHWEAIGYTVLTVLCTPEFVALASLVVLVVLCYVLYWGDFELNAASIYTGINIFLAYMLVFVLKYSNPPDEPHGFDKMWIAAIGVFFVLLILTYATSLREQLPTFFAIVYAVLGFLVLGLLGHVQIDNPVIEDCDSERFFLHLLLAVSAFIVMSYGEITRSSWLWFPPKPDEIRLGTWVFCKLALEKTTQLDSRSVQRRILYLLYRLKLVRVSERKLILTSRGWALLKQASEIGIS